MFRPAKRWQAKRRVPHVAAQQQQHRELLRHCCGRRANGASPFTFCDLLTLCHLSYSLSPPTVCHLLTLCRFYHLLCALFSWPTSSDTCRILFYADTPRRNSEPSEASEEFCLGFPSSRCLAQRIRPAQRPAERSQRAAGGPHFARHSRQQLDSLYFPFSVSLFSFLLFHSCWCCSLLCSSYFILSYFL